MRSAASGAWELRGQLLFALAGFLVGLDPFPVGGLSFAGMDEFVGTLPDVVIALQDGFAIHVFGAFERHGVAAPPALVEI
jgi:hypothetical protein